MCLHESQPADETAGWTSVMEWEETGRRLVCPALPQWWMQGKPGRPHTHKYKHNLQPIASIFNHNTTRWGDTFQFTWNHNHITTSSCLVFVGSLWRWSLYRDEKEIHFSALWCHFPGTFKGVVKSYICSIIIFFNRKIQSHKWSKTFVYFYSGFAAEWSCPVHPTILVLALNQDQS